MAQVTAVGSFSALTISVNTTKSGSITWTLPDMPNDAVIESTSLMATVTLTMTKGSASYTVNGTTYYGSQSLSLDLGTALKSSVAVTAKGNNKSARGTLSITNITYTVIYTALSEMPPVITVGAQDKAKISDETGYDECICTFTADQDLSEWEARATRDGVTPARGVGLLVESGGSLAAGEAGTVSVLDEELTGGDGMYTITVYGCGTNGIWSE